MNRFLAFLFACFFILSTSNAQDLSLYQSEILTDPNGNSLNYRIFFPKNYQSGDKFPLVLFLHGAGERGDDNEAQLVHGAKLFISPENQEKYPAIIVFPQCPKEMRWAEYATPDGSTDDGSWATPFNKNPNPPMRLVMNLLDQLLMEEKIDKNRIYISGLSMGGFGTFDLLARKPNFFAAAAPICGGGNPEAVKRYAGSTDMWIFHGDKDDVVPVQNSQKMYRALKELGASVKYSEYPEVKHDSWTNAFAEQEFLAWMFSKKLN